MSSASNAESHFRKALAAAEEKGDVAQIEMLKGLVQLARAVKYLPTT